MQTYKNLIKQSLKSVIRFNDEYYKTELPGGYVLPTETVVYEFNYPSQWIYDEIMRSL